MPIAEALGPIFLLILLGYALRRWTLIPASFWDPAETLTYYVFFPALLVANLAEARIGDLPVGAMAGLLLGTTFAIYLIAMAVARPIAGTGAAASSLVQGAIRPNTYVALAAASALWGPPGLTLMALCVAVIVPFGNVMGVIALVLLAPQHKTGLGPTLAAIAKNPIILACIAGMSLNLSGIGLPPVVGPLLKTLGGAALALGLLAVGSGIDFAAARRAGPATFWSSAIKLAGLPAAIMLAAPLAGLSGLPFAVAALYGGMPAAPNAYILARKMGGDAPLMAAIISITTLVAAATLPAILGVLAILD